MTFLKKLLIATSMILFTSIASAESFYLGNVSDKDVFGFSNTVTGEFTDTASFTLDSGTYEATVFNFSFANFDAIENFTISVLGTTASYVFDDIVTDFSFSLTGGDYTIAITGDAISVGTYAIAVSPVPEASTVALMLSGLGVGAFAARRRRKL